MGCITLARVYRMLTSFCSKEVQQCSSATEMAALKDAGALLSKFKDAYKKNDLKGAESLLTQLKLKLIELPSLPPASQQSPTAKEELTLARDAFEHAALLSIKLQDEALMERAFAQLKAFYMDTASQLPPSPHELELVGLNLLRLLVANRIAEFHTELELVTPEAQAHPYVANAIQLEKWLMQGAYNKLLGASKQCLSDLHATLMSQLASTVRDEVASCCERAYSHLQLSEAQRLMMFDNSAAVLKFAQQRGWKVQGNTILFQPQAEDTGKAGGKEVAPMNLITNVLVYAKELERIV